MSMLPADAHRHLLQDQDRGLSRWLSNQPGARLHATEAAAAAIAAQQPIGYMSPEQQRLIRDVDGASGTYIPMRATPGGKFTLALYAAQQGAESPKEFAWPGEMAYNMGRGAYERSVLPGDGKRDIKAFWQLTSIQQAEWVAKAARASAVERQGAEPSPTAGMDIAQRIVHVGGRNNAAGYIEFGSVQAVGALVAQVLRDLPASNTGEG